jgi:hypothetical protein
MCLCRLRDNGRRIMARIFISYRREDTGGYAGRLCDRLTARFGSDQVFMDLQDIQPGENFVTSIEETMAACDCVLVVIGPRWLETVRERLQSGDDFVRHEVGAALRRRINVIPVLVGRAGMPKAGDLRRARGTGLRNAVENDERFDDVAALRTPSRRLHSLRVRPHARPPATFCSGRRLASPAMLPPLPPSVLAPPPPASLPPFPPSTGNGWLRCRSPDNNPFVSV